MTIYDYIPLGWLPYLSAAGFLVAVAVGRTLAQYSHYRQRDARPLPVLGYATKHQTDLLTDWSLGFFAILAGVPVLAVIGLSSIGWSVVQVGIQRGLGLPDFHEGEPKSYRLSLFGYTLHVPKITGRWRWAKIGFGAGLVAVAFVWQPLAVLVSSIA